MPGYIIVINFLLILVAFVVVIAILMQEGSRQGLGTIGGAAETFFGKSKGRSYEGKLELITKIGVTAFILLAIVMTTFNARQGISNQAPVDLTNAPSVADLLNEKTRIAGDGLDTTLPEEPETTETPAELEAQTETAATEAPVEAELQTEIAATEAPVEAEVSTETEPTEAPIVESVEAPLEAIATEAPAA